jgi:hypothetical protein
MRLGWMLLALVLSAAAIVSAFAEQGAPSLGKRSGSDNWKRLSGCYLIRFRR